MLIPARILRAYVDDLTGARSRLSATDLATMDRILAVARSSLIRHGRTGFTLAALSVSLRMSPMTIKRHFIDVESIIAEILQRHMMAIIAVIGQIPLETPNRRAACRAAYAHFTRAYGAPTDMHMLLLRERHALPEDLLAPLERLRDAIGDLLAGIDGAIALTLLDTPSIAAEDAERMLAVLQNKPEPRPVLTSLSNFRMMPEVGQPEPSAPPRKVHTKPKRTQDDIAPDDQSLGSDILRAKRKNQLS